jgi:hypothetical protein
MTARRVARRSRTPNEDADDEDKYATDDDLEGGLQERRIHIARADPGDDGQLDRDDGEGDRGRDVEMGNEIDALTWPARKPRFKGRDIRNKRAVAQKRRCL